MKFFFILFVSFFLSIAASNAGWKDTIKYSNGDKYFGFTKDGKPHGKGVYTYANGDICTGTFKKGYFDECELFQKKGSTKWTYRLYFNENNILRYEVPSFYRRFVKCKHDKKTDFLLIKRHSDWVIVRNDNEGAFCLKQVIDRERNYKILLAVSILVILGVIYLIILARRNNAINNYNLKHKTKFKKYLDYKKHIDKIKSKELKKDEKRRSKLQKTPNLDDEKLGSGLKKIKRMYNDGNLTKVEFEKAKNKLLK